MNEASFFNNLIIGWFILAAIVFVSLFFFTAPYGRHAREGWGPSIHNKNAWLIMEAAAPLVFALCFVLGNRPYTVTTVSFLAMWQAHYLHRAFIYPFSRHDSVKQMPVLIMGIALLFNAVNGYLNGRYVFTLSDGYSNSWLADPRFVAGLTLFIAGFIINRSADQSLRNLRRPQNTDYKIPCGGLFRWVSCPNYLGEIIIWSGWALATWSLAGLAFTVWTSANLVPRARAHHDWYRRRFPDYPPQRRALLPGIW